MDNQTLFYICGIVLAVSALVVSFAGLKMEGFPGKGLPAVILWFVVFVVAATTFATRYSGEEHEAKAAEYAKYFVEKEAEESETSNSAVSEGAESTGAEQNEEKGEKGGKEAQGGGKEAGSTLEVEASPTALAFNTTELTAKAGKVTIDFKNPSATPHDVVIEQNGKQLAQVEQIAESEASTTANLKPGTYTFFCSLPGHRQAGMEGTLTVE